MIIHDLIQFLETIAPASLQEDYDNAGLLTGKASYICTGVLISLDCTEAIVQEAIDKKCNLIIAHHPIIFSGLKKINGNNCVERTIIKAIKNDIAIYAIHTNLDNVLAGVNGKIAAMLGLQNVQILFPKKDILQKLAVFVPAENAEKLKDVLFAIGAGNMGNYSECTFSTIGTGSFTPQEGAKPYSGKVDKRSVVQEVKIEVIFPTWLQGNIIKAMKENHPYKEVAYDIYSLNNYNQTVGSGIVGYLPQAMGETEFLQKLITVFKLKTVRHTHLLNKPIQKVALCGGAGSFLLSHAKSAGAHAYITADVKYHEFFDADDQLLLADIGHYESEQYTIDLLFDILTDKFPTFAHFKTGVNTNPIHYFAS